MYVNWIDIAATWILCLIVSIPLILGIQDSGLRSEVGGVLAAILGLIVGGAIGVTIEEIQR